MPPRTDHNPHEHAANTRTCVAVFACAAAATGLMLLATTPTTPITQRISLAPIAFEPETQPDQNPDDQHTDAEPEHEGIRECVITLKSGRTITGELVREDSRIVVVGIEGIETTFQRRLVANVVILPPVAERYEKLRSTIAEDDIESRLALVEWLRARKAYNLALEELNEILLIEPQNPHAKLLHTWLAEYDKLSTETRPDKPAESGKTPGEVDPDSPDEPTSDKETRTYQIRRNEMPLLSEEQINLMRVYEIDLRDPPKMRISDEVMLELMKSNPDAFSPNADERQKVFNLPEIEKLKLLFTLKARDLYPRVELLENPNSLKRFKDQVHHGRGWLINACASTRCHGGVDAGSFQLINDRPHTDETAFTNLYIIENTTLSNGLPLIDFNAPERSPLLQMAVIPSNSLVPHPEIPRGYPGTGFRPIFRHTRDRKYQQAVDWIRSMYQPRPELDFDYPPAQPETSPNPQTKDQPDQP